MEIRMRRFEMRSLGRGHGQFSCLRWEWVWHVLEVRCVPTTRTLILFLSGLYFKISGHLRPSRQLYLKNLELTLNSYFGIFFYLFIYLFIYWLHHVLVAARGLFVVLQGFLSGCGAWAQLLHDMWDLPQPRLEPVSPALQDGFLTTGPPGKSL